MTAYSHTPLPRKLGIKDNHRIAVLGAPCGFQRLLAPMPRDVEQRSDLRATHHDVIVLFAPRMHALEKRFESAARRLVSNGGLWIAWPKKTSGVATDVNEAAVRRRGLSSGLVDNKICAIDHIWSGLRFVYRVQDR